MQKKAMKNSLQKNRLKQAIIQGVKGIWNAVPIIFGVVILVSLLKAYIPIHYISKLFTNNFFIDPLIGSALGGILAGNPITSYIIGGELLTQGISFLAVTAFLVSWVTVGVAQFPAESILLGKRFAISRNILAFVSSIVVAILTVSVVSLL